MHNVHWIGRQQLWPGLDIRGPKCGSHPRIATPQGMQPARMTTDAAQVTCMYCQALLARYAARGEL